MKARLEFTLPEEASEYKTAVKAPDMASVIWEFTNTLRSKTKYAEQGPKDWDEIATLWWDTLKDYSIDPYGE